VQLQYDIGERSFAAAAPQVWNRLPDSVRVFTLCEDTFAKRLKSHLIIEAAAPLTFNCHPLNELIIIIIIIIITSLLPVYRQVNIHSNLYSF